MPRRGGLTAPGAARSLGWLVALADVYYYAFGLLTAPFWVWKLLTSGRYREGFARRFGFGHPDRRGQPPALWVHGVSVGEVLAARDLIKRIRAARPDLPVVLTVTTRTGYAIARQTYPDLPVTYFPMDTGHAVRRTLARLNPACLILVELELWPNVLLECHRRGVPVAVVNGRITARSFRGYRLIRWALEPGLSRLASACVQTGAYGERLAALGVPLDRLRVTGNLKFDAVDPAAAEARREEMRRRLGLADGQPTWVAGSVHPGEVPVLLQAHAELRRAIPDLKWVVVPRHPEKRDEIAAALKAGGAAPVRLSRCDAGEDDAAKAAVVMGDTMGDLMAMYAVARAATVGGTWVPIGGHNPLEPASVGVPSAVGPHRFTIKDAVALLEGVGGLRCADSGIALAVALRAWLADPAAATTAGAAARTAVERERGATARTLDVLTERLPALLAPQ